LIKLDKVTKEIKGKQVVHHANLELTSGNFTMIHGHNGSGKTMLLRLLCGLIKPTSGQLFFEKQLRFGVIIENPTFLQHETAFYNLKYLADINKIINVDEINRWLKRFNLFDVKDKKVKSFSLGMKQRLALVQAFMENPDVILLDEPFNGIDDDNLSVVYEVLAEEKRKGKMIIVASHVEIPVNGLITQKVRMSDGKIVEVIQL